MRQAAAERAAAEQRYRATIVAAYEAGASYVAIAAAAGVSRQAVRQLVERAR